MSFVYHRRHPDFRGETLYPLNALAELHPDLYAGQAVKYRGREVLMESVLPLLNVRWNDVIHCSPIHPHLVFRALVEAGSIVQVTGEQEFFKIPLTRLEGQRVIWFTFPDTVAPPYAWRPESAAWFDPARYEELRRVPDRTIAHYGSEAAAGRMPLTYSGIPHVLVVGPIDVAGLDGIWWSQPGAAS